MSHLLEYANIRHAGPQIIRYASFHLGNFFTNSMEYSWSSGLMAWDFCRLLFHVFHFRYKGRIYNTCINLDVFGQGGTVPWCSTTLDSQGNHVTGSEEECQATCSISNCPVGFHWVATTGTCYMVKIDPNSIYHFILIQFISLVV